jgi:hypothetical protein
MQNYVTVCKACKLCCTCNWFSETHVIVCVLSVINKHLPPQWATGCQWLASLSKSFTQLHSQAKTIMMLEWHHCQTDLWDSLHGQILPYTWLMHASGFDKHQNLFLYWKKFHIESTLQPTALQHVTISLASQNSCGPGPLPESACNLNYRAAGHCKGLHGLNWPRNLNCFLRLNMPSHIFHFDAD